MFHSPAVRGLIAGATIATTVMVCGPVSAADAPTTSPAAGCAPTVELQPMFFPTSAGPRRSASALLPDDGGALAPTATVLENRTADSDELDLVIGTGAGATVRAIYSAPAGCVIALRTDVHPTVAPEGRRSVHTPAFTIRLVSLTGPDSCGCMRPV